MNYSYDDQYAALLLFLGRTLGIIIAKSSVPGLGEAGKPALTLLRAKGCHEQGGGGGIHPASRARAQPPHDNSKLKQGLKSADALTRR